MSIRDWPTRYPRLVLALGLLLTLAAIVACFRLRPETSIEGLLDPTDPAVHALGRVLDRFPLVGEMQVFATLPDGSDDRTKLTAFAERLTQAAADDAAARESIENVSYRPAPDMTRFVSELVVPHAIDYLDDDAYAGALRRLTPDGMREQLAQTRAALALPGPAAGGLGKAVAKNDPLRLFDFLAPQLSRIVPGGAKMDPTAMADPSKGAFFSKDGRSLLIRVVGKRPPGDLKFCHAITDVTRRLIAQTNTDGLTVEVGGAYAVAAFSADAIRHDAIVGVNGSIVGIGVLFLLLYRRPVWMFLFAFTPMAFGIACGFGAFAILKPTLTPLAAVVGGALGGIGIDYLIFYLVHHDHDRATISDRAAAARATSSRLRGALRTAWLTSVVGFLSVAWSPIHVLRDFALLGTLALGGAYLATVVLLPAALVTFDRGRRPLAATRTIAFIRPLGRFLARRPIGVMGVAAVACVAALGYWLLVGRSLAPASDLMLLHPRPNPPMETQAHIADRMGIAPGSLQVYLEAKTSADLVSLAHDVDRRLRNDPRVRDVGFAGTFGVASVLPDPIRAQTRQAALDPTLPTHLQRDFPAALREAGFDPSAFAKYGGFLQRIVSPEPTPTIDSLRAYPSIVQLVLPREAGATTAPGDVRDAVCMVFFANNLAHREQRDPAIAAVDAALDGVNADGFGTATVTGLPVTSQHVEAAIRHDLPILTLAAVAWIALCHAFHFRSIGLALLSMVPTAISALAVLVFMTATREPLNLVNMVMVPLLLGIDTDYGILTVAAYQDAGGSRQRLLRAFPSAVSAVVTCAAATIIGFGSLVLVSIPAVQSLGWLINVGIGSCVLGTIVVVWPVMFWMSGRAGVSSSGSLSDRRI